MLIAGVVAVLMSASWSTARAATPCSSTPAAGSVLQRLTVDGRQRTALVHIPAGIPSGRRLALILALHGVGGNGPQMERYSGLSRVADQGGFIVAYPSSSGSFWNSAGESRLPDDVRFISRLITDLEQTECVDPQRVFATGVSNGGEMVALAACQLSSTIAAIAPVAGGYDGLRACRPARPVSVLDIHGTADQVVAYFGSGRPTADGVPPFVNDWVRRDGCSPRAVVRQLAPRTTSYRWGRCLGGVTVEHIKVRGGRHQWPGATPPDPGPPATICAACTVWSFFSALRPRRRAKISLG